ncbi:type IV secretion system DNA-binding domain-containing protein [Patescibacteria group bacterium]|jgi:CxxC-x17-CxxC domain-containing protein|nr:type IV secretion system DNA-binding domain-containing protein [Patescibacteria group bacterium]
MQEHKITFFGETNFRGQNKKFGIKSDDRLRHMYIIGKTGMGKTELLKNMIIQDILNGYGVAFVDPHGDAAEEILNFIPEERIKDVVYFNPGDINYPIAFNIMESVSEDQRHLIASGLMGVFKKIWPDVWSARMEYILNNTILSLLEIEGATLLEINRLLSDATFRGKIVKQLKDPVVKAFWVQEFSKYSQRYEVEATAAIQNKIGQFISTPLIRNIVGQVKSTIDTREIMDSGKILIINLSKGRIGEDASKLLGALLITKIQLAAMSRVDIKEEQRKPFNLYVDEFQNFATESFATILSEARKYKLSLILAHQYIAQMDEVVRDAVFGNIGTMIIFRIGAEDAESLRKEFSPEFTEEDLVNLAKQHIYVRLMIDGITSRPFSAETLPPRKQEDQNFVQGIIDYSRKVYGRNKKEVDEYIAKNILDMEEEKSKKQEQELYDAICSECQKKIKIPFKPDPNRDIFCKACLRKKETDKEGISLKEMSKDFIPKVRKDDDKTRLSELKSIIKGIKEPKKTGKIEPGEHIKF